MDVKQVRLLDFFEDRKTKLEIPPYQRIYSWTQRQCLELWLDILRAARDDREHFSGIVIMTTDPDSAGDTDRLSVVDGQQRLTTTALLLAALADHLVAHGAPDGRAPAPGAIRDALLHGHADGSDFRKLTLSRDDDATIEAVIEGRELPPSPSKNIVDNLAFFAGQMAEDGFDAAELWEGLGRLTVIACFEENSDYAQEVFESANSKGLPLTLTDMVRNYLLLGEDPSEQSRLYDEYWYEAAELYKPDPGSTKMNSAITAWIAIRFRARRIGNSEYVYSTFKHYVDEEFEGDREGVLEELRAFCFMWREQYRYHATKKFMSRPWAVKGARTLTQRFRRQKANDEEAARRVWAKYDSIDEKW